MYATNEQTLVLGPDMRPVNVVPWHEAITMLWKNQVEVISEYDGFARSTFLVIKIPAVVRLLRAFRRDKKPAKFSRINVYARDNYRCQYCGKKCATDDLTYDHVVPRSQGGRTEWTNIVSACVTCNGEKAGRTPAQAGMRLRRKPVQPIGVPAVVVRISRESVPAAWRDFLYWTGELEE
jgi:5-methylcytosine-specific restriction endonuclease McrA